MFVLLPQAPLPSEYPTTLAKLAALTDATAKALVHKVVGDSFSKGDRAICVLAFPARGGHGLAAVEVLKPPSGFGAKMAPTRGFRPGKAPPKVVAARSINAPISGRNVVRLDSRWIHGRDGNESLDILRE